MRKLNMKHLGALVLYSRYSDSFASNFRFTMNKVKLLSIFLRENTGPQYMQNANVYIHEKYIISFWIHFPNKPI